MRIRAIALTFIAFTLTTACDAQEPFCEKSGEPVYVEEECYDTHDGAPIEGGTGTDVSGIDISAPFIDLGAHLGAAYEYKLGAWTKLMLWNPLVTRSGPVGYGQLGGSEDYNPEYAVAYITEVLNFDVDGDGIVDAQYAVVPFVEDEDEPFIGNVINLDQATCYDPESEYYGSAACWMMFTDQCGAEFTAWDMEEENRGECSLSILARNGRLEQGPEVSTF